VSVLASFKGGGCKRRFRSQKKSRSNKTQFHTQQQQQPEELHQRMTAATSAASPKDSSSNKSSLSKDIHCSKRFRTQKISHNKILNPDTLAAAPSSKGIVGGD
jgi:hypothetical protein